MEAVKSFRELAFYQLLLAQPDGNAIIKSDGRNGTNNFEAFYRVSLAREPVQYTPTNTARFSVQTLRRGGVVTKVDDIRLPFD